MNAAIRAGSTGKWRAASYVRLSKEDDQQGDSDSIVGQRMLIDDWALRRKDVEIVARYGDDGFSGATFDRPGFTKMIEDARRGMFDTIVVKDLSRFGRSYLDCGSWIERELPQMGVRLYSITDDFDSMAKWDYNMSLLVPVKNLMNEMQVMTTSEKVRASLAAKRARGECVANFAPYGYLKDPADRHHLVIDPKAAEVVQGIFRMRLNGVSASEIARHLNESGIPCPALHRSELGLGRGTQSNGLDDPVWHAKTVLRILRDETYTGTLVQGKTRRPNWRMHIELPVPSDEWVRVENTHEAIVAWKEFAAVAELLAASSRRHGGPRKPGSSLGYRDSGSSGEARVSQPPPAALDSSYIVPLLGRLLCGGCGAPMCRIQVKGPTRGYSYYVCSAHRRNSRVCGTHSIREEELLSQVELFDTQAIYDADLRVSDDGRVVVV